MAESAFEVDGGIERDEVFGPFDPTFQGCGPAETAMGSAVVFGFDPATETHVEFLDTWDGIRIKEAEELCAGGSIEPFLLASTAGGVGSGVDEENTERIEDAFCLGTYEVTSVVHI